MVTVDEMRQQIVKDFSPAWDLNDRAHRFAHFSAVENCGLAINERLDLGFDPKLIMLAAFFHDMFAWSRHNHHHLSSEWVKTCDYNLIVELSEEERLMVAAGCNEHRASGKDPFTCDFAELICSADREFPGDIPRMLERAVLFRQKQSPKMSVEEGFALSVQHLKEKFGVGGYARYPSFYTIAFGEELAIQREQIMAL